MTDRRAIIITCAAAATTLVPLVLNAGDRTESVRYDLTTEIGMPHLEENLRYTTRRETACLTRETLYRRFAVLDHPALSGCHLGPVTPDPNGIQLVLACEHNPDTRGTAVWSTDGTRSTGVLHIRLGGKNMTFFQRVTAIARGACSPD